MNADNVDEELAARWGGFRLRPPPARLSLLMATGTLGPASGEAPLLHCMHVLTTTMPEALSCGYGTMYTLYAYTAAQAGLF